MVLGGAIGLCSCQHSWAGHWDLGKTPALLVFRDVGSQGLDLPVDFQDSRNKKKCGARAESHHVVSPSETENLWTVVRLL